jgi:hypothetical protein
MMDCVLRIEKLTNGYKVEVVDQKIIESNRKPKSEWQDPWKAYAFTTADEVKTFVGLHLDSLKPAPGDDEEFSDAFKQATKS